MSYEQARSLMNRGVSRPTLYSVELPSIISRGTSDYLKFFCKTTAIPSVSHQTVAANGHEYQGVSREQPIAVVYGKPFTITVIENSDFSVYKDLRSWFDRCAINSNPQQNSISQRMNYYSSFVQDMKLTKLENPKGNFNLGLFDLDGEYDKPLTVNFFNAYPVSIGQIALSSDAFDTTTTYDISFTYETYNVQYNGLLGTIGNVINAVDSLL